MINTIIYPNYSYNYYNDTNMLRDFVKSPITIIEYLKNLYLSLKAKISLSKISSFDEKDPLFFSDIRYASNLDLDLNFLNRLTFLKEKDVFNFFITNQHLLNLVFNACSITVNEFKNDATYLLKIEKSNSEKDEILYLIIRKDEYPENFKDQIKLIRRKYRNLGYQDSINFHVTTDYQ